MVGGTNKISKKAAFLVAAKKFKYRKNRAINR